ncbi:hypothetical protein QYE76_049195 [Lolium multiflorum]|uniref:Serpin domain-containing protein n=1 Tax=Lolium multiflorum TaxID=4521 RepID=A0AAD8SMM0_LOLMU|nr:hypothetical protein QYE76_049195 [Lolium multiflorum]
MEVMRNSTLQADSVGLAALSAGLARYLAEENAGSNLVFSPLSIYAALALLAAGARGDTLDEILRIVGARSRVELEEIVAHMTTGALEDQSDSGGPRVAFASGIWSDLTQPLKPGFREAVVGKYKAEASTVDFINDAEAARGQINEWIAQATSNLIGSIFGPGSITPLTRVVLGNAMYFKGKWVEPFDKKDTRNKLFHQLDGRTVEVPFMQSWDPQFIAVHKGFKVLKLRYQMAQSQDAHNGLPTLAGMISSRPGFLHEHMPKTMIRRNKIQLPKFKLSFESSIVTILKKLGLQLSFGNQADFSHMVDHAESGLPMVLSDVIHKAVIEVNEEGTKAVAFTMMRIFEGSSQTPSRQPPRVNFVADHPFAYFIVEEVTGAVVFAGHVLDPSREN